MSGPDFKVYDSNEISINFNGIPIQGGFADGEVIKISYKEDAFKEYVGTDGTVTRSATHNQVCEIELNLAQSSPTNAILSAMHNADKIALNGAGVGPFEVLDLQGTSLFYAAKAWIVKAPDMTFDREVKSRTWKFTAANGNIFNGGN